MKKLLFILILLYSLIIFSDSADSIITKVENMQNYNNAKMKMIMRIYSDIETDNYREMEILSYSQGGDKAYMEFISPVSIRGLKILSLNNDQWIYFASTGRVKKISAKSKGKSVKGVGGDFSYEDFSSGNFRENYDFEIIENNDTMWILNAIPKKESAYTQLNIYIEKQTYRIYKIKYFTEKDGHLKDLIFDNYKKINNIDIAQKMTMINLKKNRKTEIILENIQLNCNINSKYFNANKFYK